jgi:hypothetical protein
LGTTITNQNCIREEIKEKTEFRECLLWFSSDSSVSSVKTLISGYTEP